MKIVNVSLLYLALVVNQCLVSSLEIIDGLLSTEEVEALRHRKSISPGSRYGHTFLPQRILEQIPRGGGGMDVCADEVGVSITAQIVTETTHQHMDHFVEQSIDPQTGRHFVVDDDVGLIFLNDNSDAEFVHGDTHIPIKSGTFVRFAGNVMHQTVVRSGAVHLAGPFHLKSMQKVGCSCGSAICSTSTNCVTGGCGFRPENCVICDTINGVCVSVCICGASSCMTNEDCLNFGCASEPENCVICGEGGVCISAPPTTHDDLLATDQTSGYGTIQTFSLPAYDATTARTTENKDDYYVLELPKVKAGTIVKCAMTCNQDSYGGTDPAEDNAESFHMDGYFSDSVNPSTDIVYNRGTIESTVYNACEAGISVVTNMDSDHFFLVISKPTLGLNNAKVVCKKESSSCFGSASASDTARNWFRNWLA